MINQNKVKMRRLKREKGFTLIELLVVVAIIGVLASIAIPSFNSYKESAKISRTAAEIKSIASAFYAYAAEYEAFPNDSHRTLPTGMTSYIKQSLWDEETPIGGYYNWEGPDSYPYAGVALWATTATTAQLTKLDKILDNGDLSTGRFRTGINGKPTYILEE